MTENYNLFSIVAGNAACDAHCGFCISKMTYDQGITYQKEQINWQNFHIAAQLAENGRTNTAMITSKGEPTLFPDQITQYLDALQNYRIPLKELQTNGMALNLNKDIYNPFLDKWYDLGLRTVSVSVVHYDELRNKEIYLPHRNIEYPSLTELTEFLHEKGFNVRLACIMLNGFIDNSESIDELIDFTKENNIEQLTVRPVNKPSETQDANVSGFIQDNALSNESKQEITDHIRQNGVLVRNYDYGAEIYDIKGQNVCITNSLTNNPDSENIRQLIFLPPGTITEDWVYKGATLLRDPRGGKNGV